MFRKKTNQVTTTVQELQSATPENWEQRYRNALDSDIYTLASLFDAGQTGNVQSGLRAKHELRRRDYKAQRRDVWIERIITIFVAIATTVVALRWK